MSMAHTVVTTTTGAACRRGPSNQCQRSRVRGSRTERRALGGANASAKRTRRAVCRSTAI